MTTRTDAREQVRNLLLHVPETVITLNGDRAIIGGFSNDFASVTSLRLRMSTEFAWETVARILREGGKFLS